MNKQNKYHLRWLRHTALGMAAIFFYAPVGAAEKGAAKQSDAENNPCSVAQAAANDPAFTDAVNTAKTNRESSRADADAAVAFLKSVIPSVTGDNRNLPIVQYTIKSVKAANDAESAYNIAVKAVSDAKAAAFGCNLMGVNRAKVEAENGRLAAERAAGEAATNRKAAQTLQLPRKNKRMRGNS